jgi:hypothetical protein
MHAGLVQDGLELVVLFCSPAFDLDVLAAEIRVLFGGVAVVGCTTAGEITPIGYLEGSVAGFSLSARECRAAIELIPSISTLSITEGAAVVDRLIASLAEDGSSTVPSDTFALLLIDGMCSNEEVVLSSIHRRPDFIPLLGGSAGDGMRFQRTHFYWNGQFHADAALLCLVTLRRPFRIFKRQNFSSTDTRMVVTGADPGRRLVTDTNGPTL